MKNDVGKPVLSGSRVLVVEDEPLIQMEVVAALEEEGFHVEAAGTNPSALKLLERHNFSVVILDGWLEKAWSEPIARVLQQRHIPFILCSAYNLREMPWAKPQVHLNKPCPMDRLVAEVRRLTNTATDMPEDVA